MVIIVLLAEANPRGRLVPARTALITVTSICKELVRSALVDANRANQLVIRRRRGHLNATSDLHAEDCDDTDVGWLA